MILTGKMNQVTLKKSQEDVTGKMGLAWITHSMEHFGVVEMLDQHVPLAGGSNREIAASRKIMAGAMSLIAGGERIEDLEVLREDRGLLNALGWESMVSPDTLREHLKANRSAGGSRKAQEELAIKTMRLSKLEEFTYDNDATYFDSNKDSATYSYQLRKQYSGLLGFISELGICNTMDFRSGHVHPTTGIFNQLRKAIHQARAANKKVARFRSDSAAHANDIFRLCDTEGIHYFISLKRNEAITESIKALKSKEWQELEGSVESRGKRTQWAETVYVTNDGNAMRMLVLRWLNPQPDLFEQEKYCYHAIGTNDNEIEPMAWLAFHNGRMNSENYNKELKEGLNAGYAPSNDFEMDRTYFLMNVLAYNMIQVMKLFYLGEAAKAWTVKTLRYWFIGICGKIVRTGRKYYCKIINATHESYDLFRSCLGQLIVT
jgi:hypothetical protein